jgi:hypothetical protein
MQSDPLRFGNRMSDKLIWLADRIFKSFSDDVTGLRFFTLSCGCVYYQRIFRDGDIDLYQGIYRDPEDGPCELCAYFEGDWRDRALNETVIYRAMFRIKY